MAAPHPDLLYLTRGQSFPADFRVTMPIVDSAVEHGVAPLFDLAVTEGGIDGDHGALAYLAMRSLESEANTSKAIAGLETVLDAAERLKIEIAVFKGLAIGNRWYPSPSLRPAADVDIFVNPRQISRLPEFVAFFEPELAEAFEEAVHTRTGLDHSISVRGVGIDVHTDPTKLLLGPRQSDTVWQRTELVRLPSGRLARVLDLELSLIHALINLLRDNFADLLHIHDVRLMLDQEPNWGFVGSFAETEGWTDLIRFSLAFVCEILQRPSPLPTQLTPPNRILLRAIWPKRILLKGSESVVKSLRRQALAGAIVSGRRREMIGPVLRRLLPSQRLIRPDVPGLTAYLRALYHWRRDQRRAIDRIRAEASEVSRSRSHGDRVPAKEVSTHHETL